jgi:RNA polymerase sigma-70 factor (ECF subfamily)
MGRALAPGRGDAMAQHSLSSSTWPEDPRIAAAGAGDPEAIASIVMELLPRVRNLVRYLVRGDGDVEDIAQEALVAIIRGLPAHRGEGSLRSWADKITSRVAITFLSRRRRRDRQVDAAADLEAVPDRGRGPDAYVARRNAVALLDELPEKQRHVVVMHHVLGQSVVEIAQELDVPFETVRSRLRIGIARLRQLHRLDVDLS